LIFCHKIII